MKRKLILLFIALVYFCTSTMLAMKRSSLLKIIKDMVAAATSHEEWDSLNTSKQKDSHLWRHKSTTPLDRHILIFEEEKESIVPQENRN